MFILISLFVPDYILFGDDAEIRRHVSSQGDNLLMIGNGFTWWRALNDLTFLLFAIVAIVLLQRRPDFISSRIRVILFSGLGIPLMAALYDQLIDLGQIYSVYMLPFAIFILYIMLTFIPFVFFIKERIDQQNIIQEEKKWQDLISQAEVIVVGLNRMGHVEYINPYFCELTGFKEEEVLGKDWFEFFIPSKDFYNVQGAFVEILEFEFHPHYFNPILSKNNEEKMIRWFNVRTRNHQGNITGSLSIGVDVTSDYKEKEVLSGKLKDAENLIARLSYKGDKT